LSPPTPASPCTRSPTLSDPRPVRARAPLAPRAAFDSVAPAAAVVQVMPLSLSPSFSLLPSISPIPTAASRRRRPTARRCASILCFAQPLPPAVSRLRSAPSVAVGPHARANPGKKWAGEAEPN
jgi:hypothetical protein